MGNSLLSVAGRESFLQFPKTVPVEVANGVGRVLERTFPLNDTGFVQIPREHSEGGLIVLYFFAPLALVPLIAIVEVVIVHRDEFFHGRGLSGESEDPSQLPCSCLFRWYLCFQNVGMPLMDCVEASNDIPHCFRGCAQ